MTNPQALIDRDPADLTVREMLLRLDARMDAFDSRMNRLEVRTDPHPVQRFRLPRRASRRA